MAKEGLGKPGYYRCCRLCGVVMMIFWTLVGFIAGLGVGTFVIKSNLFSDVLGGVVSRDRGGNTHVDKPNCQVTSDSNDGHNVTKDHCSGCEGTR